MCVRSLPGDWRDMWRSVTSIPHSKQRSLKRCDVISISITYRIGSLQPSPQRSANFLQIYYVGNENIEASLRCSCSQTTDLNLMKELQTMLHNNNKYLCETTEDQP